MTITKSARESSWRIFLLAGRLVLAGIFIFAAYAKLKPQASMPWSVASVRTSLSMFAMQVDSYEMLPPQAVRFASHSLPFFELALGLWLLSGLWLQFSSLFTALLLGGFFAVMVRTYAKGIEVNCGCFGPGEQLGWKTLVRDGSMLALALAVTIGSFVTSRTRTVNGVSATTSAPTPQRAS
jgi:uncharacterized membrane protein YphA (DoxX/SURF4 family)